MRSTTLSRLLPALCLLFAMAHAGAAEPVAPVTIHLAGDSTMAEKLPEKRPETGWGERLAALFRPGTVAVDNRAKNGRSTRTFIEEGRWEGLLEAVRPGDLVLIQFGHNDASVEKVDRYTPPADYERNLARFVADVRGRKAVPVLLTPVARRRFDNAGRMQASHGEYPDRMRALAAREGVAIIDLERRSTALLQEMGVEGSKPLFLWIEAGTNGNYPKGVQDNTHFSPEGAARIAREFAHALCGTALPLRELLQRPCD